MAAPGACSWELDGTSRGTWEEQKSFCIGKGGWHSVPGECGAVSFLALNLHDSLFVSGGGGRGLWFFLYGEIL